MGRFVRPQLYCRVPFGILNEQADMSPAATYVDGGDGRLLAVQTAFVEGWHGRA
jgi:hypothetical protein